MQAETKFDFDVANIAVAIVIAKTGINLIAMRMPLRTRSHVLARQELMYLLYASGKCSYPGIAQYVKRDWSTVMHGCRAHRERQKPMTTQPYFECHITCEGDKVEIAKAVAEIGWIFSAIDNDIVLGAGVKSYATKHVNAEKYSQQSVTDSLMFAKDALILRGVKVIRAKVELVVFDERYK